MPSRSKSVLYRSFILPNQTHYTLNWKYFIFLRNFWHRTCQGESCITMSKPFAGPAFQLLHHALHLLRILPADEMRATLVENSDLTNRQVSLFDSQ
jgi:hypothetical protein